MKFYNTFILFFLFQISSFAQSETDDVKFLESLIRKTHPEGQIVYTDRLNIEHLNRALQYLRKSVITGITNETKMNSIVLSKQEKKLLFQKLNEFTYPFWTENLFSNSIMIKDENISGYIKKIYREYSESFVDPTNSAADKSNIINSYSRPSIFEFSLPVYLRENTIFVVFHSYYCGSPCGFDELSLYKLENKTYKKWLVVYLANY